MNDNFTISEQLTRYLDNELDGAERLELEQKLATDTAVRTELDNLRLAQQAVRHYGLQQQVAGVHRQIMQQQKQKPVAQTGILRRMGRYSMAAAATIIIIVSATVAYQYFTVSSGNLFKDNYSAYQLPATRGTVNNNPLQQAYGEAKITSVTTLFEQETNPTPEDCFIAGNAYMQLGNAAKAIQSFALLQQKNVQQQTHIYSEDAEYYMALAYLQNNEPAKALPLFKQIHNDASHAYHDKVSGWQLQKLEWLVGKK